MSLTIKNNDIYMDGKRVARIFDIDSHSMRKLRENLDYSQKRRIGIVLKASLDKVTNFLQRN